jgi:predicted house-cleaning noncanonical NTP pyrophosphatase (MazG superfamily)
MKYNKLIRDKIPQLRELEGKTIKSHIADDEEYWDKLKHKLKEEAAEFFQDETEAELADILEVIEAICQYKTIDKNHLEELRLQKRTERGSFEGRIILDEISD